MLLLKTPTTFQRLPESFPIFFLYSKKELFNRERELSIPLLILYGLLILVHVIHLSQHRIKLTGKSVFNFLSHRMLM